MKVWVYNMESKSSWHTTFFFFSLKIQNITKLNGEWGGGKGQGEKGGDKLRRGMGVIGTEWEGSIKFWFKILVGL